MRRLRFNARNILRVGGSLPPDVPIEVFYQIKPSFIRYKEINEENWIEEEGVAMFVPDTDRIVHTIELNGLEEDKIYEFQTINGEVPAVYTTFKGDPSHSIVIHYHTFQPHPSNYNVGFSNDVHKFRTLPSTLDGSMKFAQISDTHGTPDNAVIISQLAAKDVRCIIHSGDIATGNGGDNGPETWYTFFNGLNNAIDTDGCIIPMLANLGNHEVMLGSSGTQWDNHNVVGIKPDLVNKRGDAEWYYCFFPSFPGLTGYGVVDFGNYASVWQLDPGITTRTDAGQDLWLADTLQERSTVAHKLLSFHYSPFPIGRRVLSNTFNVIRRDWCPIYEPYKPLVLVGHEHVWGVTVPILGGAFDIDDAYEHPDGVVYIGAGPSGATHREGRNPHTKWWIKDSRASVWDYFAFEYDEGTPEVWQELREPHEADGTTFTYEETNNWWLIELESDKRTVTAFDLNENEIYSFVQTV